MDNYFNVLVSISNTDMEIILSWMIKLLCFLILIYISKVLFFTKQKEGNFTRQDGKITFDQTNVSPRILGDKK